MITLNHSMIKELSLAVIFGLLIGFGLTGTFYFIKQNNNSHKNTPNIVVPTPSSDSQTDPNLSPTTAPLTTTSSFEVTSPQTNDIISTSKTTLKGVAPSGSLIVITTPLKNYHLNTNAQGNFSQVIDLEPGYNVINLTSIDQNDQESHLEIFLTYSTTKLE